MPLKQGILIIDADDTQRNRLESILQGFDLFVLSTGELAGALDIYRSHKPALVFIAMNSKPEPLNIIAQLNTLDACLTVVGLVSTRISSKKILEAMRFGVREFICQPATVADLKGVLSRFLLSAKAKARSTFSPGSVKKVDFELVVDSQSSAISSAVRLVSSLLSGILERKELVRIELGLDEALRNAYEHGNLAMSAEEKRVLCETELLEKELEKRELEARKAERFIALRVKCDKHSFFCSVSDQGSGFDWQQAKLPKAQDISSISLHGRGLKLITAIFDSVMFNQKGNEVTLSKRFS